jgi:S-adenosylmethionine hydrolase
MGGSVTKAASDYRVYLVDKEGRIFHGQDVSAPGVNAAIAVGLAIREVHPEPAYGFEIWKADSLIFNSRAQSLV